MRTAIATLILTHLAASSLTGCQSPPSTPQPGTGTVPPATIAAPQTTSVATSPPQAVATPTAAATASVASTANSLIPQSCDTNIPCPAGLVCVGRNDGHREIPGPGTCLPPGPRMGGRPLVVDGAAHVSREGTNATWTARGSHEASASALAPKARREWREKLARAAGEEHASVAAFARTICQLTALGAPSWLVAKTSAALSDEIEHARGAYTWAIALGGEAMGPGAFPQAVAPFSDANRLDALAGDLLRDVFRGGCIGETLAAHDADDDSSTAPTAELRALYTGIAHDEARHAALAFDTVVWLVQTFPVLAGVLAEERARLATIADHDRALVQPLVDRVFAQS